jgi:peptidoglycan/LPS O-acetylase OafA/YrhL
MRCAIISVLLVLWVVFVIGYIVQLVVEVPTLDSQVVQWRVPLVAIQVATGVLMDVAAVAWFSRDEERGVRLAIGGLLLALVALQLVFFYLSQFSAITATLPQLAFLGTMLRYRRWYLSDDGVKE